MVVLARAGVGPGRRAGARRRRARHVPRALGADVGRRAARALRRAAARGHGRGARVPRHGRRCSANRRHAAKVLFALAARRRRADRDRRDRPHGARAALRHEPCTAAWPTSRSSPAPCSWRSARPGVEGHGGMGLWGPAVFTIPLLAAWYSYEHLALIRRTYDQTIRALGAAPELGGMVRDGHAERVADLTVADRAATLGFSRHELGAARDRRAAAPPRSGVSRRTRRRPPARAGLGRAGRRDDPPRHAAARAGRRHHRRRVDAVPRARGVAARR